MSNNPSLDSLARTNNKVLFKLSTVFPFKMFPTQISIEPTKVDIVESTFFGSHDVKNILIKEISSVSLESTPFFAVLKFKDKMPTQDLIKVEFLNKDQAHQARRIIEGLMVAQAAGVDFTQLSATEIITKIESIGQSKVD